MKNTDLNLDLFTFKNGVATYDGRELTQSESSQGYMYVHIEGKSRRLHRLIALKHIPNPHNFPCIDHIDDNPGNNEVSNLQWVTYSTNNAKAWANNPNMALMLQGPVNIIAEKGDERLVFQSVRAAGRHLNRCHTAVSKVLNGHWGRCAGYKLSRVSIITE